jgi:methionyl-tRNA synthetase
MEDSTNSVTRRWYITTSIPYVNAKPHLGHAQEFVETDMLARYHRMISDDTRFLSGTDDNSLKNVQAAEKLGVSTQELVNNNADQFYALREALNLSFDDFIRTSTDPRHTPGVQKLWEACNRNGDIYKKGYEGLYCVGCEQFYTESELKDGLCPEHLTPPELVKEENYFFRLSRYQDTLREMIESDRIRVLPQSRKNEILSFIRQGLVDFSVSRSRARARGWGIPVPGDPEQVIYVWFDALGNYITALDYASDGPLYQRYWVENPNRVHVIGKGIIRFHAVYWPAMLLSAGVPVPTQILVHSYVTLSGGKISKSLGNVIDPLELANQYGTDPVRYYLLREVRSTEDSDFTYERFIRAYNSELADQLGNLLQRVVSMVGRYFDKTVPAPGADEELDRSLLNVAGQLPEQVAAALNRFALHDAIGAVWELVGAANKYVEDTKPWELAKQRKASGPEAAQAAERLATTLYNLVEALRLIAHHLYPFLPGTAEKIANQLGIELERDGEWSRATAWGGYPVGRQLQPGGIIFPKIVEADEAV